MRPNRTGETLKDSVNLAREKFGLEVRPELVGKYEQNHPPIFYLFSVLKLIVNSHYSGAGHLKFSLFVFEHLTKTVSTH